ncbi:hypothetical protein [Clostridium sp. YIM B02555]|uniref:hypothetical protein n=1 Tax=Clostridium sp. YIM B02555 TaxID=2911968 RepID=UPI001EED81D0|nr:hypothetical protein [Clostridium sp. YIM B02555]
MAGNEKQLCTFLFKNLNKISLNHLGQITSLSNPQNNAGQPIPITTFEELNAIKPDSSSKKADIYINNIGVSLKQHPSCNLFNRLQRSELPVLLKTLKIDNSDKIISKFDYAIHQLHNGQIRGRNRSWNDFLSEDNFKIILKYLMMTGSPNIGNSMYPASLILEGPKDLTSTIDISVFTFDEFFHKYKDKIKIAIRRSWYGQASDTEHNRASGLMSKPGNERWVFNTISGKPRGWRDSIPPNKRKTVYYCMIEKVK